MNEKYLFNTRTLINGQEMRKTGRRVWREGRIKIVEHDDVFVSSLYTGEKIEFVNAGSRISYKPPYTACSEFLNHRCHVVKAGTGQGKSTMMKHDMKILLEPQSVMTKPSGVFAKRVLCISTRIQFATTLEAFSRILPSTRPGTSPRTS